MELDPYDQARLDDRLRDVALLAARALRESPLWSGYPTCVRDVFDESIDVALASTPA